MKKQEINYKKSFIKKLFVKICRLMGYEIIDQNQFFVPTLNKTLNENLSTPGKKSITLPLGEVKITRKVKALKIIFRSCTNVNMLTQNKKRLFDKSKSEYTFRSLNSILKSLSHSQKTFPNIDFEIDVIDFNSKVEDLNQIKKQLSNMNIKNSLISLDINEFKSNIKKINAQNNKVTENQMSNMSNIHKSLLLAKHQSKDLIYFVEDDYLHQSDAIQEMIFAYERLSSQFNRELFLCPADYPYLYAQADTTKVFLGESRHWRQIDQTLCTFLTSKKIVEKYWNEFVSMCKFEHYPFEKPFHKIYEKEHCLSPIPTLAIHFTNINSVFGLSPNTDWEKAWVESELK